MKINYFTIYDNKKKFYTNSSNKVLNSEIKNFADLKRDIFISASFKQNPININKLKNVQSKISFIDELGLLIDKILETNSFSKEEENRLKFLIQKTLSTIKSEDRILGEGFHETVYKINDKYAVKINPKDYSYTVINKDDSFQILDNKFNYLKRYYGGIIAKFGNFKILKNLGEHIPAGIPKNPSHLNEEKIIEYYRTKYLPVFAKVPQESYNDLLKDCSTLNKKQIENCEYYCNVFDYINPNNIVLKDNKLYWVDQIRCDASEINATIKIINMMLNRYGIGGNAWILDGFGSSLNNARTIFNKIIIAGTTVHLPFRSSFEKFSTKAIDNIFNNLKIKEKSDIIIEKIELINKIPEKDIRISQMKEYLDSL